MGLVPLRKYGSRFQAMEPERSDFPKTDLPEVIKRMKRFNGQQA